MKSKSKKPRICIALPSINYLASCPYVLSTLPIVPHLEQDFDVTLVFRKVLEPQNLNHKYLTILDYDHLDNSEKNNLNHYFFPGLFSGIKYLKYMDKFAKKYALEFDVIIEKEWHMLGSFSRKFQAYNIPTVVISEAEFISKPKTKAFWQSHPLKKMASLVFERSLPYLRKHWIRQSDSIITETEQMKYFLIANNYAVADKSIYPITNGIDPDIFFPRERNFCRQKLGIEKDTFVLTYVGSLNRFIQEPTPVIEALGNIKPKNTELHIVGDGAKRQELETIAKNINAPVYFHGKLSQHNASFYIGAANLCVAPYDKTRFPGDKFTSSSLKVIEYLACGRLVLTIPCDRMEYLLDRGKYGFLVENTTESYQNFLDNLPTIEQLSTLENTLLDNLHHPTSQKRKVVLNWTDVAQMYKQVINKTLSIY